MSNHNTGGGLSHEKIETSNFLMIVLILIVLPVLIDLFSQQAKRIEARQQRAESAEVEE